MSDRAYKEFHASGAETTTGNSRPFPVSGETLGVVLDCTAASGTSPTLDVSLEWSNDATNFHAPASADTLAQLTTTGGEAKSFTAKGRYVRAVWTIGGTTPSFTFTLGGLFT